MPEQMKLSNFKCENEKKDKTWQYFRFRKKVF